jgi:Tol biopolymer transport system component
MNLDGSNVHTLLNADCYDDGPDVNPVDRRIVFHNAHVGLLTINADGSNRQAIPNTLPGDYYASWSPDGQWIVFARYGSSSTVLNYYKIRADGTGLTQLTDLGNGDAFDCAPAWTADGSQIVVGGTLGAVTGLYSVAADGSGATTLLAVTSAAPNWVSIVVGHS